MIGVSSDLRLLVLQERENLMAQSLHRTQILSGLWTVGAILRRIGSRADVWGHASCRGGAKHSRYPGTTLVTWLLGSNIQSTRGSRYQRY
jgi:hypothetical protein